LPDTAQISDSHYTGRFKIESKDQTHALVQSGVLPPIGISDTDQEPVQTGKINWSQKQNHDDGSDGGSHPWSQPAYQGGWWSGKLHMTPTEKLRDSEYKSLSPQDKIKYNSEDTAAEKYESTMVQWELGGKKGPAPTKPDMPEHDAVEAKVTANQTATEKQVRMNMTPEEQADYDRAKAYYDQEVASSTNPPAVTVPPELADYNRRIARATGLTPESSEAYLEATVIGGPIIP
jgi:hypothetical protein